MKEFQKSNYGFILPNGQILYGPSSGTHDLLARKHGFGRGKRPAMNDDTPARDEAIRQGWVRFRDHNGHALDVTYNESLEHSKETARKYVRANPGMQMYVVNDQEFSSQQAALRSIV